jgi:hypothetical protein
MRLLLTGDYFYDYKDEKSDISKIKNKFCEYDYVILNYEGSLKSNTLRSKAVNLSMSENSLDFDTNVLMCLSNNHIMDFGKDGYEKTISLMKTNNLKFFGLESKKDQFDNYKVIEKDNLKVCIDSFGWANEECVLSQPNQAGNVNLTKKNIEMFFEKIKSIKYDNLLIYVHYGYEYEYYPLPLHVDLFRYMIDLGADFIYSSHSHILQPYEVYKDKYIFYGLGNFYFASRRDIYPESSDLGLFLDLEINKTDINITTKYINYDRLLKQSVILDKCTYLQEYNLDIKSFKTYSSDYAKFRKRKKNPRPILYKDSEIMNSLKFRSWKMIVDITGFLKIRQIVKKILGW